MSIGKIPRMAGKIMAFLEMGGSESENAESIRLGKADRFDAFDHGSSRGEHIIDDQYFAPL